MASPFSPRLRRVYLSVLLPLGLWATSARAAETTKEDKAAKFAARRVAEGPKVKEQVIAAWKELMPMLAKAELKGEPKSQVYGDFDTAQDLPRADHQLELLFASRDGARLALAGKLEYARDSIERFEEVFPETSETVPWRKALMTAYENRVNRGDNEAAIELSEIWRSDPALPPAVRYEQQLTHQARWLRVAIERGNETAIYRLPDVGKLYAPIYSAAHENDNTTPEIIKDLAKKLLPAPDVEHAAIVAEAKRRADNEAQALAWVRAEEGTAVARVDQLLKELEAEAARVKQGQSPEMITWDFESDESVPALHMIDELPPTDERDRVYFARQMTMARTGHYNAMRWVAEQWSDAGDHENARLKRLLLAIQVLLLPEAKAGSPGAIRALIANYQGAQGLPGWPRNDREALTWVRAGLLAGVEDIDDIPASIYQSSNDSTLVDPAKAEAWNRWSKNLHSTYPNLTPERIKSYTKRHPTPEEK